MLKGLRLNREQVLNLERCAGTAAVRQKQQSAPAALTRLESLSHLWREREVVDVELGLGLALEVFKAFVVLGRFGCRFLHLLRGRSRQQSRMLMLRASLQPTPSAQTNGRELQGRAQSTYNARKQQLWHSQR